MSKDKKCFDYLIKAIITVDFSDPINENVEDILAPQVQDEVKEMGVICFSNRKAILPVTLEFILGELENRNDAHDQAVNILMGINEITDIKKLVIKKLKNTGEKKKGKKNRG